MEIELKALDKLLEHLYHARESVSPGSLPWFVNAKGGSQEYGNFLQSKGLATPVEYQRFVITSFGRKVFEAGGWIAYQAKLQQEDEQKVLELSYSRQNAEAATKSADAAEKSERHAKSASYAAWAAGGLTLLSLILAVLQNCENRTQSSRIDSLNVVVKSIGLSLKSSDSLLNQAQQSQLQARSHAPKTASTLTVKKKK
ncbi:hypothetical protein [Larkinella punicea]|uniref:Uncharacterized protein n=1 Tax=Larkinella punicea TaxID=2315727 RepID=A0A368JMM3_9BACT|nr:hypothetical protein [Larkinella punicea]RCR68296.1 hypothetical protein DUE52_18040 [Larkinella punicea]